MLLKPLLKIVFCDIRRLQIVPSFLTYVLDLFRAVGENNHYGHG